MNQAKPKNFGPPGPSAGFNNPNPSNDPSKRKQAEDLNMQASITVPLTINQTRPQEHKRQGQNIAKKKKSQDISNNVQGARPKVQKTGGVLPGKNESMARKQEAEGNQKNRSLIVIQEWTCSFQQLIQGFFFLQKILKNDDISQNSCLQLIDMFKLTESQHEKQKSAEILNQEKEATNFFQQNKYLRNCKDVKVLKQVVFCLLSITRRLLQNYAYLSNKACLKLIDAYIDLNKSKFYNGTILLQGFIEKETPFQNSTNFYRILKGIVQIKQHIFLQYQIVLKYLVEKKNTFQIQKSNFLQKLMKSKNMIGQLIGNVWQSFVNILQCELNQRKGTFAIYSFEINLLIKCLNLCFELEPHYFTKEKTLRTIFPVLLKATTGFQKSSNIQLNSFDQFLLNLILVHPFTISTFNSEGELQRFIRNEVIAFRYGYLNLLSDKINVPEALTSIETALFLQNYLKRNLAFSQYNDQKHNFIFNSICEMFKGAFSELMQNKGKYKTILSYIEYIVNKISRDYYRQPQQYEPGEYSTHFDYLNVCKIAKLITKLCLTSKEDPNTFTKVDQLLGNDPYIAVTFLSKCVSIVKIIGYEERSQFQRIQNFLNENQISSQVIYQHLYKLLIIKKDYFQIHQQIIQSQDFESVGQFYEALICSYIINFIDKATVYHLNMQAFSVLISAKSYSQTCQQVIEILSSLSNQQITLVDSQNNYTTRNEMQLAIEKMLEIRDGQANSLSAFGKMVLMLLEYNNKLAESPWVKGMVARMKKLTSLYHPIVLQKYNQTLLFVLDYLGIKKEYEFDIQNYFDFKCINLYLHNALAFDYESQNTEIFNKYMSCRKYNQVNLAVKLLKKISELYIREKQNHFERIPFEVKKMMERENRGSDYQLIFTREASSYALSLAVIALSKEFHLDPKLNLFYPDLKDEIFQTLINMKEITTFTHYQMNFKVCNLYNRSLEIQMNQNLKIENLLAEHIRRNPTYISFEYLRNISNNKLDLNKQIYSRLTIAPTNIDTLHKQSRFVLAYWKALSQGTTASVNQEAWKGITSILDRIKNTLLSIDLNLNRKSVQKTLKNIFLLLLDLKNKKNFGLFTKLVYGYHQFFIDYNINNIEQSDQSQLLNQTMSYVLNIKSIIPLKLFQSFMKNDLFHRNLKNFVSRCLDVKKQLGTRKNAQNDASLFAELGLVCALDVCSSGRQLKAWLQGIYQKTLRRIIDKGEILLRQIMILLLAAGKLQAEISPRDAILKGEYWELLTNKLGVDIFIGQLLLLDIQSIFDRHQIFFISFCHYFVKMAKTSGLSKLLQYNHLKLKKSFMEIIKTLLIKSINQNKSYYVIWLIEILSEICLNKTIAQQQGFQFYREIRSFIFTEKTVFNRINELFGHLASKMALDCKNNQVKMNNDIFNQSFTISKKQELLAYIRLITFIYFDQKHQIMQSEQDFYTQNQEQEKVIAQKELSFQSLMFDLIPLFTKLIVSQENQINIQTQCEKSMSSIKVQKLAAGKILSSGVKQLTIKQVKQVWDDNYTILNLLNEVINYELISLSTVWISLVVQFKQGKTILHPSIFKNDQFDLKIDHLVRYLEAVIQKLQSYKKSQEIISKTLAKFEVSIYQSLAVSKEMHFTNGDLLNSHLDSSYNQITYKLSEVAYTLYKMLQNIFVEKKALKSSSALNYRRIFKNLKQVKQMIQKVDQHFALQIQSTTHKADSDQMSKNYTHMVYK